MKPSTILTLALSIPAIAIASYNIGRNSVTPEHSIPEIIHAAHDLGQQSIILQSLDYQPAKPNPGIGTPLNVAMVR